MKTILNITVLQHNTACTPSPIYFFYKNIIKLFVFFLVTHVTRVTLLYENDTQKVLHVEHIEQFKVELNSINTFNGCRRDCNEGGVWGGYKRVYRRTCIRCVMHRKMEVFV